MNLIVFCLSISAKCFNKGAAQLHLQSDLRRHDRCRRSIAAAVVYFCADLYEKRKERFRDEINMEDLTVQFLGVFDSNGRHTCPRLFVLTSMFGSNV